MRFVYRHMAFLGEESVQAAAASECAAEQDRFWEYHDALFTHTAGRAKGVFTTPLLERYAADIGLDSAAFNACVESGRYNQWVDAQTERGRQEGVNSTPTLTVNGRRVAVPASFEELRVLLTATARSGAPVSAETTPAGGAEM